jgi:hypothetical protein
MTCTCCDPPRDVWWAGLRIPFAGYVLGMDPAQFYPAQPPPKKPVSEEPIVFGNGWPPPGSPSAEDVLGMIDELESSGYYGPMSCAPTDGPPNWVQIVVGHTYRIPTGVDGGTTEVTVTRIDSVGCGPAMVTFVGHSGVPYTMTLAGFRGQLRRALS